MPDNWEQNYGNIWYGAPGAQLPDPLTPDADSDPDQDTMTNLEEYLQGVYSSGMTLNPSLLDTDGDAMNDSYEVRYGLNLVSNDADLQQQLV